MAVVRGSLRASPDGSVALRVLHHGAELEHAEYAAVEAHALLAVEHRPPALRQIAAPIAASAGDATSNSADDTTMSKTRFWIAAQPDERAVAQRDHRQAIEILDAAAQRGDVEEIGHQTQIDQLVVELVEQPLELILVLARKRHHHLRRAAEREHLAHLLVAAEHRNARDPRQTRVVAEHTRPRAGPPRDVRGRDRSPAPRARPHPPPASNSGSGRDDAPRSGTRARPAGTSKRRRSRAARRSRSRRARRSTSGRRRCRRRAAPPRWWRRRTPSRSPRAATRCGAARRDRGCETPSPRSAPARRAQRDTARAVEPRAAPAIPVWKRIT